MEWKVEDFITGEITFVKNYEKAEEVAERIINIHKCNFTYRHTQHHYAIQCDMIVDTSAKTIIVKQR